MKAIKYLLLIMLCFYGEQIYSQKSGLGARLYCVSNFCDSESGPRVETAHR